MKTSWLENRVGTVELCRMRGREMLRIGPCVDRDSWRRFIHKPQCRLFTQALSPPLHLNPAAASSPKPCRRLFTQVPQSPFRRTLAPFQLCGAGRYGEDPRVRPERRSHPLSLTFAGRGKVRSRGGRNTHSGYVSNRNEKELVGMEWK